MKYLKWLCCKAGWHPLEIDPEEFEGEKAFSNSSFFRVHCKWCRREGIWNEYTRHLTLFSKIGSGLDSYYSTKDRDLIELLDNLREIADIKVGLPLTQRGWCSVLGLYVQSHESYKADGSIEIKIEAGGKLHSHIDAKRTLGLFTEDQVDRCSWKVKKYERGEWEGLVKPTLKLVKWLSITGGLYEDDAEDLNRAIEVFKETRTLELPK